MAFRVNEEEEKIVDIAATEQERQHKSSDTPSVNADRDNKDESRKTKCTEDLFNAHDFDITIDLEVPVTSEYFFFLTLGRCYCLIRHKNLLNTISNVTLCPIFQKFALNDLINIDWLYTFIFSDNPMNVMPKPLNNVKDTGPRRSLNLEDYKKKRGLI